MRRPLLIFHHTRAPMWHATKDATARSLLSWHRAQITTRRVTGVTTQPLLIYHHTRDPAWRVAKRVTPQRKSIWSHLHKNSWFLRLARHAYTQPSSFTGLGTGYVETTQESLPVNIGEVKYLGTILSNLPSELLVQLVNCHEWCNRNLQLFNNLWDILVVESQ
jgi:hypothetical protein